jgi:hypothetical protein
VLLLIAIAFFLPFGYNFYQKRKQQAKKKLEIRKDDGAFKVKEDGTIVRIDKTSNTDISCDYTQTDAEKKQEDRTVREIEEESFSLINSDYVYWTTQGINTDIHLFCDCSVFHGRKVSEGNVRKAVEYFLREREVQTLSICETCKQREKNINQNSIQYGK